MLKSKTFLIYTENKEEFDSVGYNDLREKILDKINEELGSIRIINVIEEKWISEIRPRQDNSSTWFDRRYLRLIVYYQE